MPSDVRTSNSGPAVERSWRRPFATNGIRAAAVCLAVAMVLALSGGAHNPWQAARWCAEALCGVALGVAVARWLTPAHWFREKLWAAVLLIAVAITAPLVAIDLGLSVWLGHAPFSLGLVRGAAPTVFATTLAMTALALMVRRPPTETHAAAPDSPPPKFLARLPERLRGAELLAVEAEDHYLRLHTDKGQDLILMRLADAIAELDGLEGAQTHRSWWVARGAVTTAERMEGRAVLTLKDGCEAPVSRGFAKGLRAAGWF
ncbi:MAG: LytTR family DNA-binding domain-containing protein [Caulobacteraceae bacterium]